MILFRDQIQDSYTGSRSPALALNPRSRGGNTCGGEWSVESGEKEHREFAPLTRRTEMPDQVRHDGKGLSSRNAPIRDLALLVRL